MYWSGLPHTPVFLILFKSFWSFYSFGTHPKESSLKSLMTWLATSCPNSSAIKHNLRDIMLWEYGLTSTYGISFFIVCFISFRSITLSIINYNLTTWLIFKPLRGFRGRGVWDIQLRIDNHINLIPDQLSFLLWIGKTPQGIRWILKTTNSFRRYS